MFNWVCPQCGKDVPPSKTECPFCAERAREAALAGPPPPAPPQGWYQQPPPPQGWQPQPPPPPQGWQPQAPPPQAPPPQAWQPVYEPPRPAPPPPAPPQYQPAPPPPPQQPQPAPAPQWGGQQPPVAPPFVPPPPAAAWAPQEQPRTGPPTWLMAVAFTVAFLGILTAVYYFFQRSGKTSTAEKAGLESPATPSRQKVTNPLQKYVEVVGIRMVTENKKPVAKFVVVNHSGAEIADLAANVTLWASTSRSEEDSVGSFSFKVNGLAANASQELTEPLKTKLKMYELPDWQNATAEIEITSPQP